MGNLLIANSNFLFNSGKKDDLKKKKKAGSLLQIPVLFSQYLYVLVDLGIVATAIKLLSSGVQSV